MAEQDEVGYKRRFSLSHQVRHLGPLRITKEGGFPIRMTGGYPLEQLDHVTGRLVRGDPAGVIPRGIAKPPQVDRVNGEPLRNEGIHQRDVFGVMLQVKIREGTDGFPVDEDDNFGAGIGPFLVDRKGVTV